MIFRGIVCPQKCLSITYICFAFDALEICFLFPGSNTLVCFLLGYSHYNVSFELGETQISKNIRFT